MNEGGFIQIVVLGALVTLAAVVGASMVAARADAPAASALERLVRTDVAVTSGFVRTMAAFDSEADDWEERALRGEAAAPLGGIGATVLLQSESGKIDVLLSDPELLVRLADKAGLPAAERMPFAQSLQVARQQGDPAGALDIARARLSPYVPQLDEIVTRFGTAGIDPIYASAEVLNAIPDLNPADAARIAATPAAERGQFMPLSRHFASGGRRFSIVTRVEWGPEQITTRRLPIEISTAGRPIVLGGAY